VNLPSHTRPFDSFWALYALNLPDLTKRTISTLYLDIDQGKVSNPAVQDVADSNRSNQVVA
jgi:hypothetical protein